MPHLRYRHVASATLNPELGLLDSLMVRLPSAMLSEQYCSLVRLKIQAPDCPEAGSHTARGVRLTTLPSQSCILRKIAAVTLPAIATKNQQRGTVRVSCFDQTACHHTARLRACPTGTRTKIRDLLNPAPGDPCPFPVQVFFLSPAQRNGPSAGNAETVGS
jgi:hypothetical protein